MTGRDWVTAALRLIGAVAPGESLAAAEATDGLAAGNRMLDSWSNEKLLIPATVREEFALTPSDGIYTMGSGANFNTTRPMKITQAAVLVDGTEIPLHILENAQEWAEVCEKEATSSLPAYLYAEGTYPNERLNLYPVPTEANDLVLYSEKPLTQIASLAASVSLPPGYERAMVYNLACELAPEYGRPVDPIIMQVAQESKAQLKRTNSRPYFLKCDTAITGSGSYNIYTGGYE